MSHYIEVILQFESLKLFHWVTTRRINEYNFALGCTLSW